MRTKLLTATAVLLASLAATGTAWAHCGVPHDHPPGGKEAILHPSERSDVVLRTETSNNFWGGDYKDAAAFTLYGDGRLVHGDGSTRQLTEADVQRLLGDARRVGLLGDTEFGNALVTDQGTTTVEVHAGSVDRTLDIYALELVEGDRGLPRDQRHARRALRAFLHGV